MERTFQFVKFGYLLPLQFDLLGQHEGSIKNSRQEFYVGVVVNRHGRPSANISRP